jgi:hypothetical protein
MFPANVTQRFVELLAAKDPRALTIAEYFFMLLKMEDHIWWLDRLFGREFKDLMNELLKNWWPRMEWPLESLVELTGNKSDKMYDCREQVDFLKSSCSFCYAQWEMSH